MWKGDKFSYSTHAVQICVSSMQHKWESIGWIWASSASLWQWPYFVLIWYQEPSPTQTSSKQRFVQLQSLFQHHVCILEVPMAAATDSSFLPVTCSLGTQFLPEAFQPLSSACSLSSPSTVSQGKEAGTELGKQEDKIYTAWEEVTGQAGKWTKWTWSVSYKKSRNH